VGKSLIHFRWGCSVKRAFLSLAVFVLLPQLTFADFDRGLAAYNQGDYATALKEFLAAAEQGHVGAQVNLGMMYRDGRGIPKDYTEAERWYRKAAEQGYASAQFKLGLMYENAKAVRWLQLAAEQGHAGAQLHLGLRYANGRGVTKNYSESENWYRRAAEQGLGSAQANLGYMYKDGHGVVKNYVQAYKWLSLVAAEGQVHMVTDYRNGSFVIIRQNFNMTLSTIERQMTRDQIAESQSLAAAFRPRKENSGDQFTELPFFYQPSTTPPPSVAQPSTTPPPSVAQPRPAPSPSVPAATVRRIQTHLAALGYDPGPADGVMGTRTTRAIRAFQRDAGIEPDGIASSTLEALLAAFVEDKGKERPQTPKTVEAKLAFTGTGFFVTNQGHVLTNHHVVDSCAQIRVTAPEGSSNASLLAIHENDDLVLLLADVKPIAVAAFRLTTAALGEDVSVVGYPLHGLLSGMNITSGSVSSTSGIRDDARYLQITAPVQPGNSGGPLLDSAGAVVGVVVSKLDAVAVAQATGDIPQNVNFAIKSPVASSFLSIHGIEYRESAPDKNKSRVAIAAEAQKYTVLIECWK
jgi:uncharacterized protein